MNANGKNYSGSLPVEVGGRNVENLNVTIGTGITLTGHLRVEGETTENLSNIQIRLMPREPRSVQADTLRVARRILHQSYSRGRK